MKDEQFDDLMRDAAHTYHRPPDAPLDDMWAEIEKRWNGGTVERWNAGGHCVWSALRWRRS